MVERTLSCNLSTEPLQREEEMLPVLLARMAQARMVNPLRKAVVRKPYYKETTRKKELSEPRRLLLHIR